MMHGAGNTPRPRLRASALPAAEAALTRLRARADAGTDAAAAHVVIATALLGCPPPVCVICANALTGGGPGPTRTIASVACEGCRAVLDAQGVFWGELVAYVGGVWSNTPPARRVLAVACHLHGLPMLSERAT